MYSNIKRLFDIPVYQKNNKALLHAFNTKENGVWQRESTISFLEKAQILSKALLEIGVQKDDKIAIVTHLNCTQWHLVDMAVQHVGAILVPIYPTVSNADFEYILNHAEVKFCFVSDVELLDKIEEIKDLVPSLQEIFGFKKFKNCRNLAVLHQIGKISTRDSELENIKNSIQTEDLVTIIYTSGTTGKPKGVMLSHRNLISNIIYISDCMPKNVQRALSFLPICHVFERMALYRFQMDSVEIYFAESIDKIGENAQDIKPEIMTVVPRMIEKIYDKILSKANELGKIKRLIFDWSLHLANQYEPFEEKSFWYNFKLKIARKLIFQRWKDALGGEIKALICGSAPLQTKLIKIFDAAGIPILEGYGMTETAPIISGPQWKKGEYKVGSVGKPLKNMKLRIADDGEILVKGENVMMGYYKEKELTAENFTADGFFKTGDIGHLDSEGFLKITDRKKEMFKTSGGKYIAPQVIENKLKASNFIEEAIVVGAGEKMPCALIVPDFDFIKSWIITKKYDTIDVTSFQSIVENKIIKDRINEEIESVNSNLGNWEQIKRHTLLPAVWSIDTGELTPTLKLKRTVIMEKYKAIYEKLYGR